MDERRVEDLNLLELLFVMRKFVNTKNPIEIEFNQGSKLKELASEVTMLSMQKNVLDGSASFLLTEAIEELLKFTDEIYNEYLGMAAYFNTMSDKAWDLLVGELRVFPKNVIRQILNDKEISLNVGFENLTSNEEEL